MKHSYGISILVFIVAETVAAPPPRSRGETWGLTNSQDAAVAAYAAWTPIHISTNSGVWTDMDITGHGLDMTNAQAPSHWPTTTSNPFFCNGTNTLGFNGSPSHSVFMSCVGVNVQFPFYMFAVLAFTNQGILTGQDVIDSNLGTTESALVIGAPVAATNQINLEIFEGVNVTTHQNITTNHFMLIECDFLGTASSGAYTNGVPGAVGNCGNNSCSNLVVGCFYNLANFSARFSFAGLSIFTNMTRKARSNITYFTAKQFNLRNSGF
jgi:hypothetical protein